MLLGVCILLLALTGWSETEGWNTWKAWAGLPVTSTRRYPQGTVKSQRT